ncbi:MAG TPA: hypothetical protein VE959_01910 [Bryobacteraceae bacterium]|nr:hypothetical protein [Bryobacteraceae bacterium]
MLRLVSATLGPIPVATGGAAPSQTVEAYNAGDGTLSLSVSSSVSWITASLGTTRACTTTTSAASCIPLLFSLNTTALAAGTYTGIVTVTGSADTVDAPQTITVTVRVGKVEVYAAPGTTLDVPITTTHAVTSNVQNGSGWLSLVLDGTGSFRFVFPYRIHFAPPAGMAAADYNASVTTGGSTVAAENVTIPVTMHLTTQPIAQASPAQINLRLAAGAPALVYPFSIFVGLTNTGLGSLAVGSITTSGGTWIKQDTVPSFIAIDPSGMDPGTYNGTVAIASNAVNGPSNIPVNLTIVAKGAPLIYYQGVLDNGTFVPGDTVSQGDIMVAKGEQLSFSAFTPGQAPPLATVLGGASVLVNGTPAPLYYSSYGQFAFQMPVDTPLGNALVQVQRDDGSISNTVSVNVAARAPRLLAAVNQDYSVNLPDGSHPANVGDVLTIYAIGLGSTSPAVPTGQPAPSAEPLARVTGDLLVSFGGGVLAANVPAAFAGLTPTYAGLYQINVVVPDNTPKGIVDLSVGFPDARSNSLNIAIQ